jgi:hypothetical protein
LKSSILASAIGNSFLFDFAFLKSAMIGSERGSVKLWQSAV